VRQAEVSGAGRGGGADRRRLAGRGTDRDGLWYRQGRAVVPAVGRPGASGGLAAVPTGTRRDASGEPAPVSTADWPQCGGGLAMVPTASRPRCRPAVAPVADWPRSRQWAGRGAAVAEPCREVIRCPG
jgi:hypothetical protein